MQPRDFAAENRSLKVAAMADYIERSSDVDAYADAEGVARWLRTLTTEQWHAIAKAAGYPSKKAPSPTTQGLVVLVFEQRVDLAGEAENLERAS